jgi:hypothetical protein
VKRFDQDRFEVGKTSIASSQVFGGAGVIIHCAELAEETGGKKAQSTSWRDCFKNCRVGAG